MPAKIIKAIYIQRSNMAEQTVEEWYITKRDNFIRYLSELLASDDPQLSAKRERTLAKEHKWSFDDMKKQAILLRAALALGGIEDYRDSLMAKYGIAQPVSDEVKQCIGCYLELFSGVCN